MQLLNKTKIQKLADMCDPLSASFYMPTHRSNGIQQDRIRLKNKIQEYERKLAERDVPGDEIDRLTEPLYALLEDPEYWKRLSDGLALFRSPDYWTSFELPVDFKEQLTLEERFYLKPLFPMLTGDGRFFLLAFSRNEARLFECGRNYARPIDLEGHLPRETMDVRAPAQIPKNLQTHGNHAGAVHGHGIGKDQSDIRQEKYARIIARTVERLIGDDDAPLLFAGVEYLFPIYKEVNRYEHLIIDDILRGNPEHEDELMLHERAWQIMEPRFRNRERKAAEKFKQLQGSSKTSTDLERIRPAARTGRVEALFLSHDGESADPRLPIHDEELIANDVAVQTLFRGGTVFVVGNSEMPARSDVAALFRY